ncbi:MAG: hypothetical protein J6W10_02205 [Kiritimatiellae bacterium]|nr:hypothetical protein [Kiritimatiellia bacterium]
MAGRFFEFRFVYDDIGYATDSEDEDEAWFKAREDCASLYLQRHSNASRVEIIEESKPETVKTYELQELLDELEEEREDDEDEET